MTTLQFPVTIEVNLDGSLNPKTLHLLRTRMRDVLEEDVTLLLSELDISHHSVDIAVDEPEQYGEQD